MRSYLASLILGLAVGVVYGLVKVRSPAPRQSHFSVSLVCWLASRRCRLSGRVCLKTMSHSVRRAIALMWRSTATCAAAEKTNGASRVNEPFLMLSNGTR
jgi:Protein of unknown function (DUF1427)